MKILIVLNDSPYGIERTYNGLRLAIAITTQQNVELRVFLYGRCNYLCEDRAEGPRRIL